jgi:YegS/Rv2252/BmrU family lipid kinase
MASILVIHNPVAGHARVKALWPQVAAALKSAGAEFDAVATTAPRQATEIARAAVGRYAAVVGVGGDGTMSEILNGLMQASVGAETLPLGIIPMGNGDDFAKVLPPEARIGQPGYDWRTGVAKVASGQTRLYDVGRIRSVAQGMDDGKRDRYFLNIVDVGFGALTVRNFVTVPRFLSGYPAYLAAVLKTLVDYPSLHLRIQFDDGPVFDQTTTIAAIGNGRCFGGGFWVCPDARPDDGWFDVMVTERISRRTIMRLLPKLQRGTHVESAAVAMSRARRVVLESDEPFLVEADGELPIGSTRRVEIDLLPQRVRLMV